jgi:sugar phosphate isomerase/epimerase
VKNVLGKVDKEKEAIKNEKAKLNSIIPTMNPISNNIEEDNITLREYVNYIEKSILQKFNFDSNVIIGMQGLTFGKKSDGIPESI